MDNMDQLEPGRIIRMAGREQAPDGLRDSVMQRILTQPEPATIAPLISGRQWAWAAVGLLVSLVVVQVLAGSHPAATTWPVERTTVALVSAGQMLLHQLHWVTPAMGCALLLTLADRLLHWPHHRHAG